MRQALEMLDGLAAVCVSDDMVPAERCNLASKRAILKTQFLVFMGLNSSNIPWSALGINQKHLDDVTDDESPLQFWQLYVPTTSPLRPVGQRLHSGKSAATGVERVWSHMGNVFTPKRRCMLSDRVAQLTYIKVNMRLLGDKAYLQSLGVSLDDPVQFQSLLDEVEAFEDEEFVSSLASGAAPSSSNAADEEPVVLEDEQAPVVDWFAGE